MNWKNLWDTASSAMSFINPVLGVGANILGGLLGSKGQKDTNQANLDMNRENNEFNRQMQEDNQNFQMQMWEKSNEWNSPANQRKLLKDGGINPLTQQMSAQTANPVLGNMASAAPPVAMSNAMNPLQQGLSGASSAAMSSPNNLLALQQSKLVKEEARKKKLENDEKDYQVSALAKPWMIMVGPDGKDYPISDAYGNKSLGEVFAHNKLRFDIEKMAQELKQSKSTTRRMSYEEKISEIHSRTEENRINIQNALDEARTLNEMSGVRLNDQKVKESQTVVEKLNKDIEYIGKLLILADDDHSINQVNQRLMELQEQVTAESKKLLTQGWSMDAVGALFKALLVNLVNNVSIGGSVSGSIIRKLD